ncbi:MAG: MOSC N-terminal beta barrel domain-containing protein [Sporichthyaceae bacterium]
MTDAPAVGRVAQLWVFPVKSMSGASLDAAEVVDGGVADDRAWAVVDDAGQTVTAAQEPRLREVGTRLLAGELRLDVPGAQPGLGPDAADAALSDWLGRSLHLAHREGAGFVDVAPVHVVSRSSMTYAAEHAQTCDACDIATPRANLLLELSGEGTERDWLGRAVRVGDAVLRMTERPDHCLGAYADVVRPGRVAVGDPVALV